MTSKAGNESRCCLHDHIDRVVVTQQQIQQRIDELAADILRVYDGREVTVVGVMTGSIIFLSDLIRRLPVMMRLVLISATSYRGAATQSNGHPHIGELPSSLAGQDVLIVDDILDSGHTLHALSGALRGLGAKSVRTCVMLAKHRDARPQPFEADFVGFEIPEEFVVGYGLDFDNCFRNLPDVCVLKLHREEP